MSMSRELLTCLKHDWVIDNRVNNIRFKEWLLTPRANVLKNWWIEKLNKEL